MIDGVLVSNSGMQQFSVCRGGAAFVEDPGQDGPCVCFDVQVPVFIPISEKKIIIRMVKIPK